MARGIVGLPPVALSLHSISNLMKTVSNDEKDIASHESGERTLMKPATLAPDRREGRTPLERSSPENFLPASKQVCTEESHMRPVARVRPGNITYLEAVGHDSLQLRVDFLWRPCEALAVLGHLQTGNGDATTVRGLCEWADKTSVSYT